MEYKRFGTKYVLRIDKGEEIVESLKIFCNKENVKLGSVYGLGAVNEATIGVYELSEKRYCSKTIKGDHEITSLIGNISTMNGETYLHLHINLANGKNQVIGGHLNSALVSVTCELTIDTIDGTVNREFNKKIGINLYKF